MFAIRSKTGQNFRRGGQVFEPKRWTLVDEPNEAQREEAALEIVEVEGPQDQRLLLHGIVNDQTEGEPVENASAAPNGPEDSAENDALRVELQQEIAHSAELQKTLEAEQARTESLTTQVYDAQECLTEAGKVIAEREAAISALQQEILALNKQIEDAKTQQAAVLAETAAQSEEGLPAVPDAKKKG